MRGVGGGGQSRLEPGALLKSVAKGVSVRDLSIIGTPPGIHSTLRPAQDERIPPR